MIRRPRAKFASKSSSVSVRSSKSPRQTARAESSHLTSIVSSTPSQYHPARQRNHHQGSFSRTISSTAPSRRHTRSSNATVARTRSFSSERFTLSEYEQMVELEPELFKNITYDHMRKLTPETFATFDFSLLDDVDPEKLNPNIVIQPSDFRDNPILRDTLAAETQRKIYETETEFDMQQELDESHEGPPDALVKEFLDVKNEPKNPLTGKPFDFDAFLTPTYKDLLEKYRDPRPIEDYDLQTQSRKGMVPFAVFKQDMEQEMLVTSDTSFQNNDFRKYKIIPTRSSGVVMPEDIEKWDPPEHSLFEDDPEFLPNDFQYSPTDMEEYRDFSKIVRPFTEGEWKSVRQYYRFDQEWIEKLRQIQRELHAKAGLDTHIIDQTDDEIAAISKTDATGEEILARHVDEILNEITLSSTAHKPSPGKFYLNFSTHERPLYAKKEIQAMSVRFLIGQQTLIRPTEHYSGPVFPGLVQVWTDIEKPPREWYIPGGVMFHDPDFGSNMLHAPEAIPLDHIDLELTRDKLRQARERLKTEKDENERIELSLCEEACFGILHAFDISNKRLTKAEDNITMYMPPLFKQKTSTVEDYKEVVNASDSILRDYRHAMRHTQTAQVDNLVHKK